MEAGRLSELFRLEALLEGVAGPLMYQLKPPGRPFAAEMIGLKGSDSATSLTFTEFTGLSPKGL